MRHFVTTSILAAFIVALFIHTACPSSALAQTPSTWRTSLDTVNIRLLLKDTAFALTVLNRVVERVPDTADAWYCRATLFAQMGRWEDVAMDCGNALQRKEMLEYYLLKSDAELAQKQGNAAMKTLSLAVAAFPKSEIPYYYRGIVALRMNDTENAIYDFSDALTMLPEFPEAYLKRGMAQVKANNPTAALRDFDSCVALDPSRAEAYFLRGSVKIDQGKKQEAAKDLIKAAELGYRMSTDLLRGYLADVVPKSRIDSLQVYTMKEVSVTADRENVVAAKEDIRTFSKRVPSIIRAMIGRSSTQAFTRQRATFGGGSGIIVSATDLTAPPTVAGLENKPTSQITLTELIAFYRNRVALLGNEKANKLMREITSLQQSLEMATTNSQRENAVFIRDQLNLVNARIQELAAILAAEEAKEK